MTWCRGFLQFGIQPGTNLLI